MASSVRQGRWTAEIEGDFVVFLIGARFAELPVADDRAISAVAVA